jgi:hypothetical protein
MKQKQYKKKYQLYRKIQYHKSHHKGLATKEVVAFEYYLFNKKKKHPRETKREKQL